MKYIASFINMIFLVAIICLNIRPDTPVVITENQVVSMDLTRTTHNLNGMDSQNIRQVINSGKNDSKILDAVAIKIKPAIQDWLDFYHLNIADFYIGEGAAPINQYEKINEFEPTTDDVYIPQIYDYSPSKQKYISFLDVSKEEDKYVFDGMDCCSQEVFLVDRKNKTKRKIFRFGSTELLEAIFWLNENYFVAVGWQNYSHDKYFIYIFGPNFEHLDYYLDSKSKELKTGYYYKNLKKRGVVNNYFN